MKSIKNIAILGGGHGGAQVAASLREQGFDGDITLISAEKHIPYHRPPLSKTYLKGNSGLQSIRSENYYQEKRITLKLASTIVELHPDHGQLKCKTGEVLSFDRLVYATGSRARRLNMAGADSINVHYLRDVEDADLLKEKLLPGQRVACIGGGFIGLEIAASARRMGCKVTLIETAMKLMARTASDEVAKSMCEAQRTAGVDVRLGVSVNALEVMDHKVVAVILDGERLAVDEVIVGIGAVANTELAEQAGLRCENGVVVDETLTTSNPSILAIGDCVNFALPRNGKRVRLEAVQNATDQAKAAAATLLDRPTRYSAVPWFWSDQGEEKLQMAGLWFEQSERVVRGDLKNRQFSVFHYEDDVLVGVEAVNRPADYMIVRRMLGAQISPPKEAVGDATVNLKSFL